MRDLQVENKVKEEAPKIVRPPPLLASTILKIPYHFIPVPVALHAALPCQYTHKNVSVPILNVYNAVLLLYHKHTIDGKFSLLWFTI